MKFFYVLAIVTMLASCSGKPIYNIEKAYVPTPVSGEQLTIKQVESAILSGAMRKGWSPRVISPGLIEAHITVRSHMAAVEIAFTESYYSITYKDSRNLKYDKGKIHGNYNRWIHKLSGAIQKQFGVRTQNF
ncbi:hypothetical protein [Aliikangiella coralliicola]|uniref:Lipoprotein n=1 Tax=Aliikangiella coralliicola TaxID=2592383 RepID=A0A545UIW9_9GAMM|nr:hypothetical protein [Aliikangiella coralliicola]TQV89408.1 hypothetical protein FLL46_00565 [Aliikangiella coralliicola]